MHAVGVPQLKTHRGFSREQLATAAAFCAVPLSIAVAEIFLALAVAWRLFRIARGQVALLVPQVFWYWLAWAGLEIAVWLHSPERRTGLGEMRHLLLVAALLWRCRASVLRGMRSGSGALP